MTVPWPYVRHYTVWLERCFRTAPGLALQAATKGLAYADVGGSDIYAAGENIDLVRYIYRFDNLLVYCGSCGNIYCENTSGAEINGYPSGFPALTELRPDIALTKIQ